MTTDTSCDPDNGHDTDASIIDDSTPAEPLTDMTGFKRNLLLATARLTGDRPHGLVIKSELESFYDEEINHGRLYQNLGELVDAGLVKKTPIDGRTNAYRLTEEAERQLQEHHRWERECLKKVQGT